MRERDLLFVHASCKNSDARLRITLSMRRIVAGLFSLLLAYAGAAHALERCLAHDHSNHALEDQHSQSAIAANHEHSEDPSWPVIHCPTAEKRLGPALQVAALKFNRSNSVLTVHPAFLPETAFLKFRNGLWLEAVFRGRFVSLPTDLPRYLFLSILQI